MERIPPRQHLGRLAAILLLPVVSYAGGLTNPFAAETFDWLSWVALSNITTWWNEYLAYQFRPLRFLILYPVYHLFGPNPVAFHLLDLLLHLACSILVFYLGWTVSRRSKVGFISALVFSMYPRHHEVVTFVAAFYSPMTLLGLIALLLFVLFLKRRRPTLYALSLLSFVFAMLSCEVVAALLPIMFLGEMLLTLTADRREWIDSLRSYRTWRKYLPFAASVMLYLVITLSGKTSTKLSATSPSYHFTGMGMESIKGLASYMVYLAYPQIRLRTLDESAFTIALSLLTAALLLWVLLKGSRLMALGVIWMVVTVLPFVLLVPFGNAERYFYLPSIGYAVLLASCLMELQERLGVRRLQVGRIVVNLLLAGYLVSSFFIIQESTRERRVAGTMANDIIAQVKTLYPQVPANSIMYFVDLPRAYKGAAVFQAGIEGGVRLAYNDESLNALYSWDPEIVQRLAVPDHERSGMPEPGTYVFAYRDGHILDRSASYTLLRGDLDTTCWYDRFDLLCPGVDR